MQPAGTICTGEYDPSVCVPLCILSYASNLHYITDYDVLIMLPNTYNSTQASEYGSKSTIISLPSPSTTPTPTPTPSASMAPIVPGKLEVSI